MTHVAPHDVPSLYNRQLLPQPSYVGLQRETLRINKVNGLVKTGIENPSTRPNHLDLGDKIEKHKLKEKIGNVTVVEVDAVHAVHIKTHLPQENPITLQREICKM